MNCRSCNAEVWDEPILDLGHQPLANAFIETTSEDEITFPLRLCLCPKCHLVQLMDTLPAELLFSRNYPYFTSCSAPMVEHAKQCAARYIEEYNLAGEVQPGHEKWVVEIASNDGYFLRHFKEAKIPCYGIEPAENVGEVARQQGIESNPMYFTAELAFGRGPFYDRKATLLLANNVLAHCRDINDFVTAIRGALAPHGRAILEFPYALELFERGEFDTAYHEHVFYFTLTSLVPLFERNGLAVFHVERIPIHGGALRIFVCKQGNQDIQQSVRNLLEIETLRCVQKREFYLLLSKMAKRTKAALCLLISQLKGHGKSIAAYGASAKSTVLLNYCGISHRTIDFICDTTPAKQGKLTPGTHIPVVPPDELLKRQPDYCLLTIWNFTEHVLKQESEYIKRGGKFIVTMPEPMVLP